MSSPRFETVVADDMRHYGYVVTRAAKAGRGRARVADLVAVKRGEVLFVKVNAPGGDRMYGNKMRLSWRQRIGLLELAAMSEPVGHAIVAHRWWNGDGTELQYRRLVGHDPWDGWVPWHPDPQRIPELEAEHEQRRAERELRRQTALEYKEAGMA